MELSRIEQAFEPQWQLQENLICEPLRYNAPSQYNWPQFWGFTPFQRQRVQSPASGRELLFMEGADQTEPQPPNLTAIRCTDRGLFKTRWLLKSLASLEREAIDGREGYRHIANQKLMRGEELAEVELSHRDGAWWKGEDVLAVIYRRKILMKLLAGRQNRKAVEWFIFCCVGIVVVACERGDSTRYEEQSSNRIEDLAWHREEITRLLTLNVALVYWRNFFFEGIRWFPRAKVRE